MEKTTYSCDIKDRKHFGSTRKIELDVIFDHDQEDGRSRMKPYFHTLKLDICSGCEEFMMTKRRYIYGYGAMGHNSYYLHLYLDKQEPTTLEDLGINVIKEIESTSQPTEENAQS